jgi:preprotein translocase subunit SecG
VIRVLKGSITVFHVLLSLGLIATVLLQSGKSAGLSGAIAGGAETFFGKKKGLDELLHKLTTFIAIGFLLSAIFLALFK